MTMMQAKQTCWVNNFSNVCSSNQAPVGPTVKTTHRRIYRKTPAKIHQMCQKKLHSVTQPRGFALVATLLVTTLVVLLILGLLTLSTLSQRHSSQRMELVAAQANAQLALALAIGDLQKHAGPDQRVTARSDILDGGDPGAPPLLHSKWTGVWRTDQLKKEPSAPSPILSRATDGSLRDRRADASSGNPTYKASAEVQTWLVTQSGSDVPPDPTVALPNEDSMVLVGPGTVNNPADEVRAPVLGFSAPTGIKKAGTVAWWIGGENAKATFNLAVPESGPASTIPWHVPSQSGINTLAVYSKYEDKAVQRTVPQAVTRASSALTGAMIDPDPKKIPFHDITSDAEGVLADTLEGGLRRDLTALLALERAPAFGKRPALDMTSPIYGADTARLSLIAPKFGVLRDWSLIAAGTPAGTIPEIAPVPPRGLGRALVFRDSSRLYPSGFGTSSAPDLSRHQSGAIHPVLLEASVSIGVSLAPVDTSPTADPAVARDHKIRLHYFPRVVLWNPYNAKLKAQDYVVQVNLPGWLSLAIYGLSSDYRVDLESGSGGGTMANTTRAPYFSIPAAAFEPGEALLFTADAGTAPNGRRLWTNSDRLADYPLSCTKPFPLVENFYVEKSNTVSVAPDKLKQGALSFDIAITHPSSGVVRTDYPSANGDPTSGMPLHYWQKLWMSNGGTNARTSLVRDTPALYPPLQAWVQSENGAHFSNAPWISSVPPSLSEVLRGHDSTSPQYPYYRMKWGHRVQWLNETDFNQNTSAGPYNTPYLGYNALSNHNLRAGMHIQSPVENCLRSSSAGGRYTHGILIDDIYGWDWRDVRYAPVSVAGKNRVSPFGLPGLFAGQTYPLLDLPRPDAPLLSLAALQHAPVSQLPWHPLNAVGNSLADPRVMRNRTINYFTSAHWQQLGFHAREWNGILQSSRTTQLANVSYLHDLSYELNHALWDKYFFSTVPPAPTTYTPGQPLANPRMVLNSAGPVTTVGLRDVNKAAASLLVRGAFNVNSTSVDAWAALLASFRADPEITLTQPGGIEVGVNDMFSRLFLPVGKEYKNQVYTESETWSGFRKLTDAQIRALAVAIVAEVKARGPFLSIADFVNRRLMDPPTMNAAETPITKTGLKGTLQAAIDSTGINQSLDAAMPIAKSEYHMEANGGDGGQAGYGVSYPNLADRSQIAPFGKKPDHNHWAESKLTGSPASLTQADVLQKLGPVLTARDDTFVIRTCGQSLSNTGKVMAQAWCEAIVQRLPEPINPDPATLIEPDDVTNGPDRFGRRFVVRSFRWLQKEEI